MSDRNNVEQKYEDKLNTEDTEQEAVARYLADMTRQLETMAIAADLGSLAYLLAMARSEAEDISDRPLIGPEAVPNSTYSSAFDDVGESGSNVMIRKASTSIEAAEIILLVTKWAGGRKQALRWYRSQPIAAFGDRTAESLVKSGQAVALRDYLDSIALGGYA